MRHRIFTYADLKDLTKKLSRRKLANNTYVEKILTVCNEQTPDGMYFKVTYYDYTIARVYKNEIYVDSCGWYSRTTKERINWFLRPYGYSIYQKDFSWFVYDINKETSFDFYSGMFGGNR